MRFSDRVVSKLTGPVFKFKQIKDFEKVNARLLSSQEYTFNGRLGFISINLNVQPDQVLGVAMTYTYNLVCRIKSVNSPMRWPKKSSEDTLKTNVLFLKMLKSTTANVKYPIWDLMMKNVCGRYGECFNPQEFRFDIYYEDPGKGQKRFLSSDSIPASLRAPPIAASFQT